MPVNDKMIDALDVVLTAACEANPEDADPQDLMFEPSVREGESSDG